MPGLDDEINKYREYEYLMMLMMHGIEVEGEVVCQTCQYIWNNNTKLCHLRERRTLIGVLLLLTSSQSEK